MTRTRFRAWFGLLIPLVGPLLVLVALKRAQAVDLVLRSASFHLVVVSAIAACALVVAVVAGRAGARLSHAGPVWLALGCLCVGLLMVAHGLSTPGVLGRPANQWVGRGPYLAITLFGIALVLASRPRNAATSRLAARRPRLVLLAPSAALAAVLAG
ncbi:MAG: hypothetical protein GEV08_14520, partial [Acidimicrobiia bacterium]|nr:hypothetical protein [Acidimicrobiia bacterium]